LPLIDSTETLPSARLQTSARSPFALIAIPDGCFPALTVAITVGGFAFRSITNTLSSGTFFQPAPSGSALIELAMSAISPEGWIARLVGGPTTVLFNGKVAAIRGVSGFEISTIETESFPGGCGTGLPSAPNVTFSSLPTIISWG